MQKLTPRQLTLEELPIAERLIWAWQGLVAAGGKGEIDAGTQYDFDALFAASIGKKLGDPAPHGDLMQMACEFMAINRRIWYDAPEAEPVESIVWGDFFSRCAEAGIPLDATLDDAEEEMGAYLQEEFLRILARLRAGVIWTDGVLAWKGLDYGRA